MNLLFVTLLQAAAQPQGAGASFWIMILLMFAVMYFFMIRPQNKQRKELEAFRSTLKKGDKVVTVGGIYGTVDEVKDTTVLLKVDGDVKLRVAKSSVVKDFDQSQQA